MRPVLSGFADLLVPPRCHTCGGQVMGAAGLCGDCYPDLRWLLEPLCQRCCLPLDPLTHEEEATCDACVEHPPLWNQVRAPLVYEGKARELVLALKHGDRSEAAPWLASQMARVAGLQLEAADVLIPVPLHWQRRVTRRYNQAALLTLALQRHAPHVDYAPRALRRIRATPSQGRMSRLQRQRNLRGAFAVPDNHDVQGRRVLLVDDVLTSGATAHEATRVLLDKGAIGVDILTATRVLPRSEDDFG